MNEEQKIIEYLKDKGFSNSVIGSIQMPAYSKIGDPYAMRNVSVTVASVMVEYIKERTQPKEIEESLIKIEDFHIGFEYEEYVLCHHGSRYLNNDGFEWKRRVYDFNSPKLLKIKKQIENGLVRHCSDKKDGV